MKLFGMNNQRLSKKQEQVAGKIAGKILKYQRQLANYLNDKTSELSPFAWLALLFGFCSLFGGYCIYLLAKVFN